MTGILLMFAALVSRQEVPQLTLEEALARAETAAFTVRVADSNIREADAQIKLAKAALGPSASLSGTTQWSDTRTSRIWTKRIKRF